MKTLIQQYPSEWLALRNTVGRCLDPNNPSYKHYGARGITVCPDWLERKTGFKKFLDHIGPKPSPNLTLDRLDNNRGYEPGNVAWRTQKQQIQNRRSWAQLITIKGISKTTREWSTISGVHGATIWSRYIAGRDESELLVKGPLPRR